MNPECKPIQKKGDRNVFCPFYGDCLDFVIEKAWETWDCRDCCHYSNLGAAPELSRNINHAIAFYEIMI
jgi:hypothetical protein